MLASLGFGAWSSIKILSFSIFGFIGNSVLNAFQIINL